MFYVVDDLDLTKCKFDIKYSAVAVKKIEMSTTELYQDGLDEILKKDKNVVDPKKTTFNFSGSGAQNVYLYFVDYNNNILTHTITVRKRTRATQNFYD